MGHKGELPWNKWFCLLVLHWPCRSLAKVHFFCHVFLPNALACADQWTEAKVCWDHFVFWRMYAIRSGSWKERWISAIWSYCHKRRPTGELLKYKAQLCVDGSQQMYGRDFWETYAPVVTWSTVRLILLLSTVLNLKSRQVDYTQAFPQADLEDPVYMRLPQGWFIAPDGTLT